MENITVTLLYGGLLSEKEGREAKWCFPWQTIFTIPHVDNDASFDQKILEKKCVWTVGWNNLDAFK
jgi:hypothetical protein